MLSMQMNYKKINSQTVHFETNQHVGFVSQKILMHLSSSLPVTWQQNAHIPCATRDTRSAALTNVSLTVSSCVFGFWVTISISDTLFASEIKRSTMSETRHTSGVIRFYGHNKLLNWSKVIKSQSKWLNAARCFNMLCTYGKFEFVKISMAN